MNLSLSIISVLVSAAALATPALAANQVTLNSEAFVEKQVRGADGRPRVELVAPTTVVPGDRMMFVLTYRNVGRAPATNFVITNPIPKGIAFQGATEASAMVSVDGGQSWGTLATRVVRLPDGTALAASAADVTHVRWVFPRAIPVGAQGKVSFRGTVR